jgi:putative tryptophan/tyrosine transport system substrate-binding protein
MLTRRIFAGSLGSTIALTVVPGRAQPPAMPVIGYLNSGSLEGHAVRILAFRRGLAETGFVEGKSVLIEFRHADGRYDRLPAMAADLVRRQVAVLAASGTTGVLAAKAATTTIPIVFSASIDPVVLGVVASLDHPGGNITGTTRMNIEVGAKRLSMLHEIVPAATTVALLVNPANAINSEVVTANIEVAARTLGLKLHVLEARNEREIDATFARLEQLGVGALMISSDAFFTTCGARLCALAIRHKMPTAHQNRDLVLAGGLMSYGGHLDDGFRIAGSYAGRILKGAKPADLPVQQSTRMEFFINLKTAKKLGITVPPTLLALADEVVE